MDLKLKNNSQLTLPLLNRVEYIESSGYPNINTGITSSYNPFTIKVEAVIEVISSGDTDGYVYNANYSNGPYFNLVLKANSTSSFAASCSRLPTVVTNPLEIEFTGKSHIIAAKGYITVNGTTYTHTGGNKAVTSSSLCLLQSGNATIRSYSYKVYKSDVLVRDYIPVKSLEVGHIGEACLYDLVNNVYYYSSSTGSFTASPSLGLYDIITSAYVKDCPYIDGIDVLRKSKNLERIRCNINNATGHTAEIYKYAQFSGFNDAGEQQTKPRIVGTFNIDDYYTDAEAAEIRSKIDGITIVTPTASDYNVDTLLANDGFAVQTFDSTKQGYNPAAAIILQSGDLGITSVLPLNDGGRFGFLKNDSTTTLPAVFRDKTTVVDSNKIVSDDDTALYSFTSFNEFEDMTNITTIADYAFRGDTNLIEIKLPNTITTIGNGVFRGCTSLKDLYIPCNSGPHALINNENVSDYCGDGTGTLFVNGNFSASLGWGSFISFKYVLVKGNCSTGNGRLLRFKTRATTFRINGNLVFSTTSNTNMFNGGPLPEFFEVIGSISATRLLFNAYMTLTISVFHAAHNQVMSVTPSNLKIGSVSKIYVGDGSSKAADQAVFDLYNADSNWSAYCGSGVPGDGKVDLWWNYNGEYKWYYITDNLTNCTNTNPDAWPHITRGESYETTIVPDEGMTIDSITVEMLDTDTTSPTYDTMVDITSSVYDSSTGEINIPSVTGNVVITASAS